MATDAYTDLTPSGGLLPDNDKVLTFTLTDANGTGVTGEAANITLYIVEPTGSITITGASITDAGSGAYTYTHSFNEAGWNYWDFLWDDSTNPAIREGAKLLISTRKTATAQ